MAVVVVVVASMLAAVAAQQMLLRRLLMLVRLQEQEQNLLVKFAARWRCVPPDTTALRSIRELQRECVSQHVQCQE